MRRTILVALILTGCAATTGVLPMGNDTYTLSVGFRGAGSSTGNDISAKRQAFADANEFCAKMGKQLLVKNISLNTTTNGSTSELVFKCLDQGAPELASKP